MAQAGNGGKGGARGGSGGGPARGSGGGGAAAKAEAARREKLALAAADAEAFTKRFDQYRRLKATNPDILAMIWWDEIGRTLLGMRGRGPGSSRRGRRPRSRAPRTGPQKRSRLRIIHKGPIWRAQMKLHHHNRLQPPSRRIW